MNKARLVCLAATCVVVQGVYSFGADDGKKVDFTREIRPILSNLCFQCHGPDATQRKGNLRLDTREGAFTKRDDSFPVVPHKPDESELLRRLVTEVAEEKMPPPKSGKIIKPEQIALVKKWIEQGAEWSDHWAFQTPVKPAVPQVKLQNWGKNPIDQFVLARLEREGLSPAPVADKGTLLRRLSLDLIGLPPTPEEVKAFIADPSADAYQKQVERLLKSPHYGEKWARQWLDAARYADSDGYEKDKARKVWFYRDWVVNALNRDLPYNEFLIEQLAGDQLPNPTQDQIVATGFLRNSMCNEEGGIDPEQFRMEAMFDRMDAIGKSILGLTIQCAQCHTHKYDPISQEEYYRVFAFLNNDAEANTGVYTVAQQQRLGDLFATIKIIEEQLQHTHPDWAERMAKWEAEVSKDLPSWTSITPTREELYTGGQRYEMAKDGSIIAEGYAPSRVTGVFTFKTDLHPITAFQLEQLNDPTLPFGGPGRSIEGTAALTEFNVSYASAKEPGKKTKVKFVRAEADYAMPEAELKAYYPESEPAENAAKKDSAKKKEEPKKKEESKKEEAKGKEKEGEKKEAPKPKRVLGPVGYAIDGKNETAWGNDEGAGRRNRPRKGFFYPEKPIDIPEGTLLTFELVQNHGGWNSNDNQSHNLGRFRVSFTTAANPKADVVPLPVRQILSIPKEKRTARQVATLFSHFRTTVPEWKNANDTIEAVWKQHPEPTSQLVLGSVADGRKTSVLNRGDFLKPEKEVKPGVPAFLPPLPEGAPTTRLTFAKWLTDRKSPTVSRSFVNRIWQAYFGTGIVASSEDLGSQSETPSHRELLDWLAVEFMDQGWKLKDLHRLIVNSATYRQSSAVTPALLEKDPFNRLLARGARFRVEGELVHDIALSASGLLDPQLGGPSTYPPAPEFIFLPPASYGTKNWVPESPSERYRRALYTFRYRSVPFPVLQVFDSPNGDFSCVRRSRSNTPLQALTTLNEPLFMECAQALARKTILEGGLDEAARLEFAFRRCTSRAPEKEEVAVLADLLKKETARFAGKDAKAIELAGVDPKTIANWPKGVSAADLAGWTAVSRVLLNLDETITKE